MKLKSLFLAAALVVSTTGVFELPIRSSAARASSTNSSMVANSATQENSSPNPEPASNAPLSQWQAWATQIDDVNASTNWNALAARWGCNLLNENLVPVNDVGLGLPSGTNLDAVSLELHCSPNAGDSSGAQPEYMSSCPEFDYWNGASITDGYECVGSLTSASEAYVGAAYTYEASGSTIGHEELGSVNSGCSTGNLVANEETTTLHEGDSGEILTNVDSSNTWTATWWKGSSTPYSNWGTLCGTY